MTKKISDLRAIEKLTGNLTKLLEKKDFSSEQELNDYLQGLVHKRKFPEMSDKNSLSIAQDLIYDAWETESRKKRMRLAHKALSISPDCADAYSLLAEEEAETVEEAKELYQKGVEAGERAIGRKSFKEKHGHFWGFFETRPYMRARAGLTQCLWELKEYDDVIAHCKEMLKLNPNDNQGMRYILVCYLAELGRYDELDDFLNSGKYKNDCGIEWLYTRALLSFIKEGDSFKARQELKVALKENSHVPDYIIGKKSMPRILPPFVTLGGEDEAISYTAAFVSVWRKIPGAVEWLGNRSGIKDYPKVGRNDPCSCGSGKKYKKCCGG